MNTTDPARYDPHYYHKAIIAATEANTRDRTANFISASFGTMAAGVAYGLSHSVIISAVAGGLTAIISKAVFSFLNPD